MPEGDTIFRTATVLRAVLIGRTITAARAQARPGMRRVPDLDRLVGASVTGVEPRGKHLLIGFDSGLTLRTHLRMSGSWHRYRPDEPWKLPPRQASVVLETADSVAVCFNAPIVELLTAAELARQPTLAALGPDLLAPDFEAGAAVDRFHGLLRVLTTARRLLRANVRGGARVTTDRARGAGALWVYGRAGRPCRRCGRLIEARRQGELLRTTYWCPGCQR